MLRAVEAGISARALQRCIAGSYRTSWRNAHKARRAIAAPLAPPDARASRSTLDGGVFFVPPYALRDEGEPLAVVVDHRRPTMRAVGTARVPALSFGSVERLGIDVALWLRCVFQGVSRKYLQRYLDAAAASLAGIDVVEYALAGAPCPPGALAT